MEVSRILLFCVLVAVAYAKGNKSERLMPSETCDSYASKLGSDSAKGIQYEECGVNNDNGEKLCYLKSMECDSIFDCPNKADENKAECKDKHKAYCDSGFPKRKRDGSMLRAYHCQVQDEDDDKICIEAYRQCDGKPDCPLEDDEMNCPKL